MKFEIFKNLKVIDKKTLYTVYGYIFKITKSYNSMTKVEMLIDLYDLYESDNNLEDICTISEIEVLEKILNNEKVSIKKYSNEIRELERKYIIFKISTTKYGIPKELLLSAEQMIKNINKKAKAPYEKITKILIGYIKQNGIEEMNDLKDTYDDFFEFKENISDEVFNTIIDSLLFAFYVTIYRENEVEKCYFNQYEEYLDLIIEKREEINFSFQKEINSTVLENLFYDDFDLQNPAVKKLNDLLLSNVIYEKFFKNKIYKAALLNEGREDILYYLDILCNDSKDYEYKANVVNEALDEMSSAALMGLSPNEYKVNFNRFKCFSFEKKNLSKEDAQLFNECYLSVLNFTNEKYKLGEKVEFSEKITTVLNKFWENRDEIIKQYMLRNPDKFNKEKINIIRNFKNAIKGQFVFYKVDGEYTLLYDDDDFYMIKENLRGVSNIFDENKNPLISTVIIPFRGYIVTDVVIDVVEVCMQINKPAIKYKYMLENKKYKL